MIAAVTQAVAQLDANDANAAAETLEAAALGAVTVADDAVDALWRLLPRLGKALGADWRKTMEKAGKKPLDHVVALKVGGDLMDEGRFGLASVLLRAAHQQRPRNPEILGELVMCLEELGRNREARTVLEQADPALLAESFELRYLLAFNTLMTADLEGAGERLQALEDEGDPDLDALAQELEAMLERAEALDGVSPLDANDLRGWHLVVNAAVLLHVDTTEPRLKGRLGKGQDSVELWRAGLAGVKAALNAWGMDPPKVFHAPDAQSALLGRAAGAVLQRPVAVLPEHGTLEPGLVVVCDVETLPDATADALQWHRAGQVLWVHASPWTREPGWTPDLVTVLHHSTEPLLAAPETVMDAVTRTPLPAVPAALAALLEAAGKVRTPAGVGAFQTKGPRRRQRVDTPVAADKT